VNDSAGTATAVTAPRDTNQPLQIGWLALNYYYANGIISDIGLIDHAVTDAEATALYNNFPDVGLVAGSVCPRKYVYPEPTLTVRPAFNRESSNIRLTSEAAPKAILEGIKQLLQIRQRKRQLLAKLLS
jgi:hypothetical protein